MDEFVRQTNRPLFPKVLWNRPLNRRYGGRLLIVGGQKSGFSQCQAIFQVAASAGSGESNLILPDSLERTVAPHGIGHFVPSSPSGSLGKSALGAILEIARDYDVVVIGGNLTNNSETAMLVESLLDKLELPLIVGHEVLEMMKFNPAKLTRRTKTLLILDTAGALQLAGNLKIPVAIQSGESLVSKVRLARSLEEASECNFLIADGHILTPGSPVVVTDINNDIPDEVYMGTGATFWIQNQNKPNEGLATAAYVIAAAARAVEVPVTLTQLAGRISNVLNQESF